MATKKNSADDELTRLKQSGFDFAGLEVALGSKHARVVASAARRIKEATLDGHTAGLEAAYTRFTVDAVKCEPGCLAKLAALEALDFTESMNDGPFLAAARLEQLEPAWGPPGHVDTATSCRARGLLALARMGHADVVVVTGALLADREVPVRIAAAEAIEHSGVHHGAGALLLKLEVGDEDPLVLLSCMSGVLTLAADVALTRFTPWLRGRDAAKRELAAMCFGQSNRGDAAAQLIAALGECVISNERALLLRALGLHRSDVALEAMLEIVKGDNGLDAVRAVRALGARRYEPAVRARVSAEVAGDRELAAEFASAFKE